MSKKMLLNDNWLFTKMPLYTPFENMYKEDINWQPVSLPHDWLIFDTNHLYESSDGWYRRELIAEEANNDTLVALRFEGVYMNTTVFVNGEIAGTWKYGYSTFEIPISDYLRRGSNEIFVQVIHEAPNSRWYSGAGIYRNVWLKHYPSTHIVSDGIYISTRQENQLWQVNITTEIDLHKYSLSSPLTLRQIIVDRKGSVITQTEQLLLSEKMEEGLQKYNSSLTVNNPSLWSLSSPTLYILKTQLVFETNLLDEEKQTFGFRSIRFDCQKGFFLNGSYLKLHGACMHHDLGCLGAAVNKSALKRQVLLLKEMGVNAIRTAHNMPAKRTNGTFR